MERFFGKFVVFAVIGNAEVFIVINKLYLVFLLSQKQSVAS